MKAYIPLMLIFLYSTAYAEPFSYLKKETLDELEGSDKKFSMHIHYDPNSSNVLESAGETYPKITLYT